MPVAKSPAVDLEGALRRLRDAMVGGVSEEEPFAAAARQLGGTAEHPVPCRDRGCKPCGCARAILVIEEHKAQVGRVATDAHALVQRGDELRALAEATRRVHSVLSEYASKLGEHVKRWERIHAELGPLGVERSHDHGAMCEAPRVVLAAIEAVSEELPELAEGLVRDLRPEVRATGHRRPDTLVVDIVRELSGVGYVPGEIVELVAGEVLSDVERAYWQERIDRGLRRANQSRPDGESSGGQ
jgi:hypothetical protein